MRLIDADDLLDVLDKVEQDCENACIIPSWSMAVEEIKRQPTAYDVDKVVEKLETARDGYSTAQLMTATNDELVKRFIAKEKTMNLSIEIVKAGGIDGN